jgi:hypothetical protein
MKFITNITCALLFGALTIPAIAGADNTQVADLQTLQTMTARYAPTPLNVDISGLSDGNRKALVKLVAAAQVVNDIFLKQLWQGNPALYEQLKKDETPLGKARLHYFWINKAPWSELDDYKAFLPDVPPRKPEGANFYPPDLKKADFEAWVAKLSAKEQEQAKSFFTVIRRAENSSGAKSFVVVPYSKEYADDLGKAAGLLREAAALTDNASLKKFLNLRADAFLSNNYLESDDAWMDLDAPLDTTIGPYETYNDEIFGYKAGYEAYLNLRNDRETDKLSAFSTHLQEIEDNLPLDPKYRNPKLGPGATIRVVDEIMSAGDGAHAVQSAAYNLPNDEVVVQKRGSKRVMLKNVQEAKFRSVLVPIAQKVLPASALADVNFEMFFTHILAHELMHGLGPHQIKVNGRDTTPRDELKELEGPLEEAKADVTGLFALQYMMEHAAAMGLDKILPADEKAQRQLYVTYLASTFRSLRFGLTEAHGKGTAMQVNYLLDRGAFVQNADGTFSVDMSKIKSAVADLDRKLLTIEAEGDYAGARDLLNKLGVLRPSIKKMLDNLQGIPSDIEPVFTTADSLAGK